MHPIKAFIIILLSVVVGSCGNSTAPKSNFSIITNTKNNIVRLGDSLSLSIKNPKNIDITSVAYELNEKTVAQTFKIDEHLLGVQQIKATIIIGDTSEEVISKLTILNNQSPKVYGYKIINEYPHDITSYTQGLEFYKGALYESTGQYGESKLRKLDYKTGSVLQNKAIGNQYFGEGLTIMNDNIYQLTWQENIGFVYDVNTFEKKSSFTYGKSKEGWGICNDGNNIYKSDGTEQIWLLNP